MTGIFQHLSRNSVLLIRRPPTSSSDPILFTATDTLCYIYPHLLFIKWMSEQTRPVKAENSSEAQTGKLFSRKRSVRQRQSNSLRPFLWIRLQILQKSHTSYPYSGHHRVSLLFPVRLTGYVISILNYSHSGILGNQHQPDICR